MIMVLSKDKYIKNWKSILLHTCSQNIDPEYKKKKLNHMSLLSKIIIPHPLQNERPIVVVLWSNQQDGVSIIIGFLVKKFKVKKTKWQINWFVHVWYITAYICCSIYNNHGAGVGHVNCPFIRNWLVGWTHRQSAGQRGAVQDNGQSIGPTELRSLAVSCVW